MNHSTTNTTDTTDTTSSTSAVTQQQRIRLQNSTQTLQNSSATLLRVQAILAETEIIGTQTLQTLQQQRCQLNSISTKVNNVEDEIWIGRKIINRMSSWWP